jgi:hypothetical protein
MARHQLNVIKRSKTIGWQPASIDAFFEQFQQSINTYAVRNFHGQLP